MNSSTALTTVYQNYTTQKLLELASIPYELEEEAKAILVQELIARGEVKEAEKLKAYKAEYETAPDYAGYSLKQLLKTANNPYTLNNIEGLALYEELLKRNQVIEAETLKYDLLNKEENPEEAAILASLTENSSIQQVKDYCANRLSTGVSIDQLKDELRVVGIDPLEVLDREIEEEEQLQDYIIELRNNGLSLEEAKRKAAVELSLAADSVDEYTNRMPQRAKRLSSSNTLGLIVLIFLAIASIATGRIGIGLIISVISIISGFRKSSRIKKASS